AAERRLWLPRQKNHEPAGVEAGLPEGVRQPRLQALRQVRQPFMRKKHQPAAPEPFGDFYERRVVGGRVLLRKPWTQEYGARVGTHQGRLGGAHRTIVW